MGLACTKPSTSMEFAKDPASEPSAFVWEEDVEGEGSKEIGKTEALFQGVGGMTFSAEMAEKWLRGEKPSQDDCSLESLEEKVTELERFSTARFYALGVEEDVGKVTDEIRKRLRKRKLDDNRMADDELHRFYLARGRDMENTVHQVSEVLEWRITNQPNGHFELEEFEMEYKRNKVVFLGYDRLGRACLLVRAKMHDGTMYPKKTDETTQTFAKFVVHVFDSVVVELDKEHNADRFVMIVDLEDSNKALARGASIETLLFASKFFPERLGAVWVLNGALALLPTMRVSASCFESYERKDLTCQNRLVAFPAAPLKFWAVYKIVSPFLTKEQKQKILFVSESDKRRILAEHICLSCLPKQYGGDLDLVMQDYEHPLMEKPNPPYYTPICSTRK